MNKHVKVVGWLWIANGVLAIPLVIVGLVVINMNVSRSQDALIASAGILCLFVPGIVADFLAGAGLLKLKNWARILAIILAIPNLLFVFALILPALGVYTLVVMSDKEIAALFKGGVTSEEQAT
jgi:hypothetical protein